MTTNFNDDGELVSPRALIREVCLFYDVNLKGVLGPLRHQLLAHPRAVAMWLMRKKFDHMSYPAIGREFLRDHSTVLAAIRRVNRTYKESGFVSERIKKLELFLNVEPGLVVVEADAQKKVREEKPVPTVAGSFGLQKT